MSRFRKLFPLTWALVASRTARRSWSALLILLIVTVAGVECRSWIFRWQAGRLIRDVRALEMNKTPAEAALLLRSKWPVVDYGSEPRPCTRDDCDIYLRITEWDWISQRAWEEGWLHVPFQLVKTAFGHFGMRFGSAEAEVNIRRGTVRLVSITAKTDVEPTGWPWLMIADAEARRNLFPFGAPDSHPYLHVRFQGPPNHGGCKPCRMTRAEYTPDISRDLFLRVTDFDLSCLTSFRFCTEFGSMMPFVKEMVLRDEKHSELNSCTLRTLQTLARDSRGVLLMRVKRIQYGRPARTVEYSGQQFRESGEQQVDYDLVEKLKWHGDQPPLLSRTHSLDFNGPIVDPETHLLSQQWFRPGAPLIVFDDSVPSQCEAVPATAAHLKAVRAGIAEDYSAK